MARKNLPEEIIADILSRLPVKSLLRFRCVCKPWFALITDPAFIKMHLSQSLATNSNLCLIFKTHLIPSLATNSNFSLNFNSSNLRSVELDVCEQEAAVELDHPLKSLVYEPFVLGSCNGLLCISNYNDEDIFLWNPSTRTHKKLPIITNPFTRFVAYGFGYDPITDDYKLVRVQQQFSGHNNYDLHSEVKVYSLSTNSWRTIGDMPFFHTILSKSGVLANSTLHWQTGTHNEFNVIASFDLKDEKFREIPLPDFVDEAPREFGLRNFEMTMGVLGGQLCLLCNFTWDDHIELWVMKDYSVKDSWAKQFSIGLSIQPLICFDHFSPVCYSKNDLRSKVQFLYLHLSPTHLCIYTLALNNYCFISKTLTDESSILAIV
ncbi:F-box protein CPR1-like [Telopea speciosissima]|uniref:F-box protein CPR1-like n=1 Tax=Telopea speciosissima TaxID=54955 RepID=UPI001CC78141|nr:F-box protein CPR1-like [Telopea speciosissima]